MVSPVFPYHKFHSTISPQSSHPYRFISSALVMVRQAWSAGTLATHGPIISGLHRISSLGPTLCWARVEDIYIYIYIYILINTARKLEKTPFVHLYACHSLKLIDIIRNCVFILWKENLLSGVIKSLLVELPRKRAEF